MHVQELPRAGAVLAQLPSPSGIIPVPPTPALPPQRCHPSRGQPRLPRGSKLPRLTSCFPSEAPGSCSLDGDERGSAGTRRSEPAQPGLRSLCSRFCCPFPQSPCPSGLVGSLSSPGDEQMGADGWETCTGECSLWPLASSEDRRWRHGSAPGASLPCPEPAETEHRMRPGTD